MCLVSSIIDKALVVLRAESFVFSVRGGNGCLIDPCSIIASKIVERDDLAVIALVCNT